MKRYKFRKTFTFEGKRYNAYGDTEREALTRMIEKKAALESGKVTISSSMTVREWVGVAFDTYKPNLADKAKHESILRVNKHILPVIGSMSLKSVKPVDCQKILNAQTGKSHSQIEKVSQDLFFIFSTAKKNKLISDNPVENTVKPKSKKGKRRSLSTAEQEAFKKACEGTDRFRVFELMYYCGCRAEEAMTCIGSDVYLDGETAMLHIRGTKTANSDRRVPIPRVFYDRIKDTPSDAPIAPNAYGQRLSRPSYNARANTLRHAINVAMGCKVYRNILVPPYPLRDSFVPYELRHTYCSNLARRKVDIRVAQRLMGHSSIKITADIYTHVEQEQILEDAKQILGE